MKSNTRCIPSPLVKMSEHESNILIKPIHEAITIAKEGKCNASIWMDIYIRLMAGLHLIEKHYTKQTLEQYQPSIRAWNDVEARAYKEQHKVWNITEEEFTLLDMAIEAVDEIQKDSKRKDLIAAYRFASSCLSKRKKNKK